MKKITAIIIVGAVCAVGITVRAITHSSVKSSSRFIDKTQAEEIALEKAGLTKNDVTFRKTKLDRDDGIYVYEVEFRSSKAKYEADINAHDGTVVKFEQEGKANKNKKSADKSELIPEESAKATVLKAAGVSEAEAEFKKTKLDRDDGLYVYEFEFTAGNMEYNIDVNAVTGEIAKFETEEKKVKSDKQKKNDKTGQAPSETAYIGKDKALELILERARLTENEISNVKVKLDRDDGIYVYEVEFRSDRTEYEAEVNAVSGEIISCEKEIDD